MAPIIAIEGIPGAGKTSVAKALVAALKHRGKITFVSELTHGTPEIFIRQLQTEIYALPIGDNRRTYLLMNLRAYLWREAVNLSQAGLYDLIITDRSWWSSEVDQKVFNISESILRRLTSGIRRKRPDLTIYLRTSVKEARKRKQASGSRGRIFAYTEYIEEMASVYDRFAELPQWYTIEVDEITLDCVVAQCVEQCSLFLSEKHLVLV